MGGNVAVPYKCTLRQGRAPMGHFLDQYRRGIDACFREMRVPVDAGDYSIWESLEKRGIIDNHRSVWSRVSGCLPQRIEVWDLARPDFLPELKQGYLTAARVLYDRNFKNPLDENGNDMLMYCYTLQHLFDASFDAADAMTLVLNQACPPFMKGELFPPVTMVHAGAVCAGVCDRAYRIAMHADTNLAHEAAEYNEIMMDRFEQKFFLSERIWESFDVDGSGSLSLEEFVEGMRNVDVYKDFRKERIPDAVLRMIISDLAERLFHEVDVNGDGALTSEELSVAFRRRREEALKAQERREWIKSLTRVMREQVGGKTKEDPDDPRFQARKLRDDAIAATKLKETRKLREWTADVDKPHLPDAEIDLDAPLQATY